MSDLIDRDETIKQFCKQDCGCDPKDCLDKTCYEVEIIESVPTHPTPSNTLGALDCVSRQDAIDALAVADAKKGWRSLKLSEMYKCLSALPSVQPETCEGCKHLGKWENEVEYGYSSPCTRCKRRVEDHYER